MFKTIGGGAPSDYKFALGIVVGTIEAGRAGEGIDDVGKAAHVKASSVRGEHFFWSDEEGSEIGRILGDVSRQAWVFEFGNRGEHLRHQGDFLSAKVQGLLHIVHRLLYDHLQHVGGVLGQKPLEADGYEVVDGHSDDDKASKKGNTNTYGKTLERLFPLEDAFKKTPSSSSWSTWMSVILYPDL